MPVCGLEGGLVFAINAKPDAQGKAAIAAALDCSRNGMRVALPSSRS
jgi:hypothetical protein